MPDQFGERSANSFHASSAVYRQSLAERVREIDHDLQVLARVARGSGTARRTRFTRRSVFVNVPSFSAKLDAGKHDVRVLRARCR